MRSDLGRPGRLGAQLRDHLVVRVEVAQVVRRHDAQPSHQIGRQLDVLRDVVGVLGQQLGKHINAVEEHLAFPGEVIEPDVLKRDPVRRDTEIRSEPALETNRDIAQSQGAVALLEQRAS